MAKNAYRPEYKNCRKQQTTLPHQGVAQGVAPDWNLPAKCWSEWQDLNLRPPRPERGV